MYHENLIFFRGDRVIVLTAKTSGKITTCFGRKKIMIILSSQPLLIVQLLINQKFPPTLGIFSVFTTEYSIN
jgi:hypothetical protein